MIMRHFYALNGKKPRNYCCPRWSAWAAMFWRNIWDQLCVVCIGFEWWGVRQRPEKFSGRENWNNHLTSTLAPKLLSFETSDIIFKISFECMLDWFSKVQYMIIWSGIVKKIENIWIFSRVIYILISKSDTNTKFLQFFIFIITIHGWFSESYCNRSYEYSMLTSLRPPTVSSHKT